MTRVARWSIAHRWIVVAGWVLLAVVGGLAASPTTGAVTLWVPLAVFALLFGPSMDYEVFILTRITEEYEQTADTGQAVIRGIGRTGRLVTSGALILCLAFIALGGVPVTDVKILSTGLASGIIIDATLIRGILAPALVALLCRYNWWLPAPIARLLHTTPLTPHTTTIRHHATTGTAQLMTADGPSHAGGQDQAPRYHRRSGR
jgi:uncharacterized membrane protein YdfJ with MMPL/SSD domain